MTQYRVLLLNRELNFSPSSGLLQGLSGKVYGQTTWQHGEGCMGVVLTLEEYAACQDDLYRAFHLPCRRWLAKFIVIEDTKTIPLPKDSPSLDPAPDHPLKGVRFFALRAMAAREHIDIAGLKGWREVADTILAVRKMNATAQAAVA